MGTITWATLVVFSLLMTASPPRAQEVDRLVIRIAQAELLPGGYDRVRYAARVEAVDTHGQRVRVATFLGGTVGAEREITWLSGVPWADVAVGAGVASVHGVSDGFVAGPDARLLVFAFAAGVFDVVEVPLSGLHGQRYRLERGSTFSRGCFPPCLCPVFSPEELRGTYALTFDHADPLFDHYAVDDVNWLVTIGSQEVRMTGSGTYRIGGEFARQHQLVLELTIGDEPPQKFDSGLIPGGAEFPDMLNIALSIHGMVCFDTVIDMRSSLAQ